MIHQNTSKLIMSGMVLMRSKRDYSRNSDAEKLDELQTHLNLQHLSFIREEVITNEQFSTRNHVRVPDLTMMYGDRMIVIELDGGVHGSLEIPTNKTKKRNADYNRAGIIYIILNEEQAEAENLDICDLASYRVREIISKLESEK